MKIQKSSSAKTSARQTEFKIHPVKFNFHFTRIMFLVILFTGLFLHASFSEATSDSFPPTTEPPTVADFLPSPDHIYYCSPEGNNDTGDGSIGNPWYDLRGAQGTVGPGDLIYFRGGEYTNIPYCQHYVYSDNRIITDATQEKPIVFSNYPGEQVIFLAPNYEGSHIYNSGDLVTYLQDSGRLYTCIYDGTTQSPDDPVYGADGSSPRWARTRWLMTIKS